MNRRFGHLPPSNGSLRAWGAPPLLLLSAALALLAGCASPATHPRTKTEFALDTACTISLYDRAPSGTIARAFSLLRNVGARMTIDAKRGELITVNAAAGRRPVAVDPELYHVIRVGLHYSRLTDGAFDITIAPLSKLWGIGTGGKVVPPEARIKRALSLVDYRRVVLDRTAGTVYLERPGMGIDLGGIAKGYAGDRVKELLSEAGVRHAIIDLGGNVVTIGGKPDGSPWRIGIQNPDGARGSYVGIVSVHGESVVSSGQYERYFTYRGKRYGHVLSTRTGYPVDNGITSATIVSASSTVGDALSTAVFALGVEKGLALIDSLPGIEAIILTDGNKVYLSGGLRGRFRLTDPTYSLAEAVGLPSG